MTQVIISPEDILSPEITRDGVLSAHGSRIKIVEHPYVQHQLTIARDKSTNQNVFRRTIYRIGRAMGYEYLRTIPTQNIEVETPLTKTTGTKMVDTSSILIIIVLRAAIPFVEGLYKYLPDARAGVISAWRGTQPLFLVESKYEKIPPVRPDDTVIVADPMLATGNTAVAVGQRVFEKGEPKKITFMSVISAPLGVKTVLDTFEGSEVWTAALDPYLNKKGYIVPGLGDAGDRCYGAPHEHEIK